MTLPALEDLWNPISAATRIVRGFQPPEVPDLSVNIPPAQQPPTLDKAREREELSRRLRRRKGQAATIKSAPGSREPSAAARVLLGQG